MLRLAPAAYLYAVECEAWQRLIYEMFRRWRAVRNYSEETGEGMSGALLDMGFVDWLDDLMSELDSEPQALKTITHDMPGIDTCCGELPGSRFEGRMG